MQTINKVLFPILWSWLLMVGVVHGVLEVHHLPRLGRRHMGRSEEEDGAHPSRLQLYLMLIGEAMRQHHATTLQ